MGIASLISICVVARTSSRIESARICSIPHGGLHALVAPQSSREHAMILFDLPVFAGVTDKRTHMIEGNAVPFINLGPCGVCVVSERPVLVEDFAEATNGVAIWAVWV